jgi:hypothetical protein
MMIKKALNTFLREKREIEHKNYFYLKNDCHLSEMLKKIK